MDFVGGSRSKFAPLPDVFELVRTGHFEAACEIIIPPVDAFAVDFDFSALHLPLSVSDLFVAVIRNHEAAVFPELVSFDGMTVLLFDDQHHSTLESLFTINLDPVSAGDFTFFLVCSRADP